MMRMLVFGLLFILAPSLLLGGESKQDVVDTLIKTEKQLIEEWIQNDDTETLPPAVLYGTNEAAVLYADHIYEKKSNLICEPFALDELVELSRGKLKKEINVINLGLPRVRDHLGQACLARPGDPFYAVGPGENKWVSFDAFQVRGNAKACPYQIVYTFEGRFEAPLPWAPFVLLTDIQLKEGPNGFKPHTDWREANVTRSEGLKIREKIPFAEEYHAQGFDPSIPTLDKFIHISKKNISLDDEGLPNEVVFGVREHDVFELAREKVQKKALSGRIAPHAVLDYDLDGAPDLLLKGESQGCGYWLLFRAISNGFEEIPLPAPNCQCG